METTGLSNVSEPALSVLFHRGQIMVPRRFWLPGSLGLTAKLVWWHFPVVLTSRKEGEGRMRPAWVTAGDQNTKKYKITKAFAICLRQPEGCRAHTPASLTAPLLLG